ncbi:hypothetical protein BECAL_03000 [Bellilinea caldifistulae]|uniref:Uncharacterized protein n=1 Tax=Bellilinea caldifistulae TaxID=360411 RepID=A0A0P6XZJ5_9CHLR|nr:hypothetical protein [Bellilinea caldifistulae]KPL74590.1 hypothetical protein AC812_12410 [Bellilinea caldifistulae]GAP11806.1 hypothetical protein BECAL_03000 [Bellilinea caldifistulae]
MDYLMRFFRNVLVLFLVVGGMLLVLLLTGQGEALNVFGSMFEVYDALGILPYVLILLILAVLPKRRR